MVQVEDAGESEGRAVRVPRGVVAPTRKGADFLQVSQEEKPWQTITGGRFIMSSLELQAAHALSIQRGKVTAKSYRPGLPS